MSALQCSSCNGTLKLVRDSVDEREYVCEHCGRRVVRKVSSRYIDARAKEKEFEHEERMADKELEQVRLDSEHRERTSARASKMLGAMVVLFLVIGAIFAIGSQIHSCTMDNGKNAQPPMSSLQARLLNHETVESDFRARGFTNIESHGTDSPSSNVEDLFISLEDGYVTRVSINGDIGFNNRDWFPKDSLVSIEYYTDPAYQSTGSDKPAVQDIEKLLGTGWLNEFQTLYIEFSEQYESKLDELDDNWFTDMDDHFQGLYRSLPKYEGKSVKVAKIYEVLKEAANLSERAAYEYAYYCETEKRDFDEQTDEIVDLSSPKRNVEEAGKQLQLATSEIQEIQAIAKS